MSQPLILKKEKFSYRLDFLEDLGARAIFTTKPLDLSLGHSRRAASFKKLAIDPACLVCPSQVHGARIALVTQRHAGAGALEACGAITATDALVTSVEGLSICVLTADCLPVFVLDTHQKAAAVIHAGWKGLQQGILSRTLRVMADEFSSRPRDLLAAFGPSIRPCCYRVGREFFSYFPGFIRDRGAQGIFMDLPGRARSELEALGIGENRIFDSGLCTCCRPDFHSFRREGRRAGRVMSLVSLLPSSKKCQRLKAH
ncbi:MAG: peptidoglycan editing factor PgeF [Candidatus Omnitrophota bacterium]